MKQFHHITPFIEPATNPTRKLNDRSRNTYIFVHISTIALMSLSCLFHSNLTKNPMFSLHSHTLTLMNSAKTSFRPFRQNFSTIPRSISIMKFFAFRKKKEMSDLSPLLISKIVKIRNKILLKVFFLQMMRDLLNPKNLSFLCPRGFIQVKVLLLTRLKEL